MKEAGYENGVGLPEITLHTNVEAKELCSYIQRQWEEFGFKIKVEVHSHAEQMHMISKGELPFYRSSWIADYPDAENYLSVFYSKNPAPPNYTRYHNSKFDAVFEKALSETNDSLRYRLYQQADSIMMEDAPAAAEAAGYAAADNAALAAQVG